MKKAQISSEFIFITSALIFILIVIIILTVNKSIELTRLTKEMNQKNECLKISNYIVYSYINGHNITEKIKDPIKTISIQPTARTITINNQTSCSIPINQVTEGDFSNSISISKQGDFINVQ